MRKSYLLAVLVASVAVTATVLSMTLVGSDAVAQQPLRTAVGPARGGAVVAILDVSYIFKNHVRFKQMMGEMKVAVKLAEDEVGKERERIRRLSKRLDQSSPSAPRKGTSDYEALYQETAKRTSDLNLKIQLQKKEFLQREAKIYHNVYQEVLQEVDYYAAGPNNVAMVLRFNGDPVDVENPDDVLRYINKPVIWYTKNLDITPIILDKLNRRPPAGPIGGRPGVQYK